MFQEPDSGVREQQSWTSSGIYTRITRNSGALPLYCIGIRSCSKCAMLRPPYACTCVTPGRHHALYTRAQRSYAKGIDCLQQ